MDEKSLYGHILNLSAPWQVNSLSLSLDENAGSVTVIVGITENTQLICPTCGQLCPIHDHRQWRHLDTCQFTTLVEANVPRVMCPKHGQEKV
jgi:transposase